jgi:hypothetical protein
MEAVCTSETTVNFNVTIWHYVPEDLKLQNEQYCVKARRP